MDVIGVGVLTRLISRDLVDDVIAECGRREKRSRLLPARVVVYFVLAMTLFYGDDYEEVMRKLVNGLRFLGSWRGDWRVPTTGAMSQARARLGSEVMSRLFERVAEPIAGRGTKGAWLGSWRVMAIDGVELDVPDTPANDAEYARKGKGGSSPYPKVRVVGLGECGTHAIVAARLDSVSVSENALADQLLADFRPGMLIMADRLFYSYRRWAEAAATGADLLWRVSATVELPVEEVFPDGSYRSSVLPKSMRSRLKRGRIASLPEDMAIPVRVIEYMITNRSGSEEMFCLLTTIMDYELAPVTELAAAYQQRWEFEISLDEIETHQIGGHRVLRSRTPDLVAQEIWALLITHFAVRHLMREAADEAGIDPDQLSFTRSLNVIRRQVTNQAAFSPSKTLPSHH